MSKHVVSLSSGFVDEISQAIKTDLSLKSEPTLDFKVIYDDDRRIYKIKVQESNLFYVLKIRGIRVVKQQDHDLSDLQKEYDLLNNAWHSAQNLTEKYSMSKPIKLWLDQKAMLLSGCIGENLNDYFNQNIFKWSYASSNLAKRIYNCGFWLGNYHLLATTTNVVDEVIETRKSHLQRMLKVLERKKNHKLKIKDIEGIVNCFNQLVSHDNSELGNVGQIHGNFAYRNVLSNDSLTNLVDFEDARIDYVGYDIGQFIAEIILKSQFPWIRGLSKSLIKEFKRGYEKHLKLQANLVEAYIGYHLLVHLYEHCSRKPPSFPKSLIHQYRINYLSKQIRKWVKNS